MENGALFGMGFISEDQSIENITLIKSVLTKYPSSDYMKSLIQNYAMRHPEKIISWKTKDCDLSLL